MSSRRRGRCCRSHECTRSAFGNCKSKWRMRRRSRSWNNKFFSSLSRYGVRCLGINNRTLLKEGLFVHMKLDVSYESPFFQLWGELRLATILLRANSKGGFWSTGKKRPLTVSSWCFYEYGRLSGSDREKTASSPERWRSLCCRCRCR